ncbi:unnamed protein product [Adineta steineri]|uniref:NAD(P)(+)--arginine ADP-ribosyltransferase n=1 Tax=Adineta steineri TaxID=433720 RepID=A0A813RAX9_9BILA|nr:unnamed protein product [Adineta steineri]CAF4007011.1 unnamed protein product [Adineta steineri]
MSESESNQDAPSSVNAFMNTNNTAIISADVSQPRRRMVRNYSLLWLDECMDETNKVCQNNLAQLRTVTNGVNVFKQRDECIDFLTDGSDIKCSLVVEHTMAQQLMSLINDIPQLHGIYIFNDIKSLHEEWTTKWDKIKSVHTNIDDLCQGLQFELKQYNQDSIAMSFVTVNDMESTDNLNQLEPTFMYTQIFKDILLNMQHNEQAIKYFITYCRNNDCVSSTNINRFEEEYNAKLAIWWYTFPSNIYSMLNYALRSMDGDTIINMGFFIHDLHQQIQQLYEQQISAYEKKTFLVYRGQGFVKTDFDKLQRTQGGLISFNNFLSTSKDKEVSISYAHVASTEPDKVGILFIMSIDPCIKSAPFAFIKEESYFNEEDEILFSMHTIFRVNAIKQMDNENQLYQVELQLTSDDDQELRLLTNRIRKEASGDTGWRRLSILLLKIRQFNKAEELCNVILEQTSNERERAFYYNQLGFVHSNQGDYKRAIYYYEQGLEICHKILHSNDPSLATSYNNIGLVYNKMGEYSKALSFHDKALQIQQKILPSNDLDLAASYNSIGVVYNNMGEYSRALSFYVKVPEILKKTLPSNHPDFAQSYNNIGGVYDNMGEYSRALSFYDKALEIRRKTLPSNHPDFAQSYNSIGVVYNNMGEYSRALSFYEKVLEIFKKTLPSNHPDLATSYNNIGGVYDNMGEYSRALSFYEKVLEIFKKTLPSNHLSLATSYNNIGLVYNRMGEYSKALSFHEQGLELKQKSLPSNHPSLGTSYNNIGFVYDKMGEYSKALSFYEQALELKQKSLPLNHPSLATSYSNIGGVYYSMREYSQALSYYEKVLEIFKETLLSNHPHLTSIYNNIGLLYNDMGEYSIALSYYEKALEIQEKTLSSNHPSLAISYNNIGSMYNYMREYSKALLFYEKTLEILQTTLHSNHPNLAGSYNNIGTVYFKIGEYSKALSYYERALNIWQRALPTTHPHLKIVEENIETVKMKL